MRFGGIVALDSVSFDMAAGPIVGLIGRAAETDADERRRVPEQKRKVPRDQPSVRHEAIRDTSRGQRGDSRWKEVGCERLAAREDHGDRIEQIGGFVEHALKESQIEMLDALLLVRARGY